MDDAALLAQAEAVLAASRIGSLPAEASLNGEPASSLICWAHVDGRPCECAPGALCHEFGGCCRGWLLGALGARKRRACRAGAACAGGSHPPADTVVDTLSAWWRDARGSEPRWGAHLTRNSKISGGERSATTSGGGGDDAARSAPPRCTLPTPILLDRIRRHAHESVHVARFVDEPWLPPALASSEAVRALFARKRAAKEVSEAYAVASRLPALLARLGCAHFAPGGDGAARLGGVECGECGGGGGGGGTCANVGPRGAGLTVVDVCSGKGFIASLIALLLPDARVVMLDADGGMDLCHVAEIPNLEFRAFDLFSCAAGAALDEMGAGAGACVWVGTHLCGSLSPRLIDLFCHVASASGLVLCPCCLRGSLGGDIVQAARARRREGSARADAQGGPNGSGGGDSGKRGGGHGWVGADRDIYELLVRTLAALCEAELGRSQGACAATGGRPCRVDVAADAGVLSPKNLFIVATK